MNTATTIAQNIADHASQQSDRWLFMVWQIICLVIVYFVGRYFIRQLDEHRKALRELTDRSIATNVQLAVVLDNNNKTIQLNSLEIHSLTKMRESLEEKLRKTKGANTQ